MTGKALARKVAGSTMRFLGSVPMHETSEEMLRAEALAPWPFLLQADVTQTGNDTVVETEDEPFWGNEAKRQRVQLRGAREPPAPALPSAADLLDSPGPPGSRGDSAAFGEHSFVRRESPAMEEFERLEKEHQVSVLSRDTLLCLSSHGLLRC